MERWNRICNSVLNHKNKNSKEDIFHTEIEYILEYVLGWSFNDIISKKRNKVFSANAYAPDIIIENNEDEKDLIVVELKRPNISLEKHRDQLFDYMRLKYSQVGLLIGDKLQVFCELPLNSKPPKLILEIDFERDNSDGLQFIKLFSKQGFSIQAIENYAQKRIDEIEENKIKIDIIDFLNSSQGNEYIKQVVLKDLKEKYAEKIIEELENDISIRLNTNSLNQQNSTVNFNSITPKSFNYKPNIQKLPVSPKRTENGMLIGKFVRDSFRKAFEKGLISTNEINDLQKPEYCKRIFNANFEVLKNKNREIRDEKGIARYYTPESFCGNYHLSSQWIESQWDFLLIWLKNIAYDYKEK